VQRRPRRVPALLVAAAALLLAYTAFRAAVLAMTYDEAWSVTLLRQSAWDLVTFRQAEINNHALNTLLMKAARRLLGPHTLTYRLPNVAAHALYLAASLALVRRMRPAVAAAAFALLNLNPFLLDFFSLARGYGLAAGLALCGVACLDRALERPGRAWETAAVGCLALATLANLSLLHALAAAQGVVVLLAAERRALVRDAWPSLLVTTGLAAALLPSFRRLEAAGQLVWGGTDGFWRDTVGSLARTFLYRDAPGRTAAALTVLVGMLVAALAGTALAAWRRHGSSLPRTPALVFFLLLCLPALSTTVLHHLAGSRFLTERTALLFVPLFGVAVAHAAAIWAEGRWGRAARAGLVAAALLLAAHAARSGNARYTFTWRHGADVTEVVRLMEDEHRRSGTPVSLMVSWPFKMPIRYYARQRDLGWLTVEVLEYDLDDRARDFYYLLGGAHDLGHPVDRAFLDAHRGWIVRSFPVSGSHLLRRPGD
jgi:hypothetical protein